MEGWNDVKMEAEGKERRVKKEACETIGRNR